MALSELNNVSIAEVAIYPLFLAVAILLAIRHGFRRNAGWLYLIVFSLCRIIGGAMQLATISQPTNTSLYVGAAVLQSIGLSPLTLVMLALLGRCLESILRNGISTPFVTTRHLRLVQTVVLVGLVLAAIGGAENGTDAAKAATRGTPAPGPNNKAQAGLGLIVAGYALLVGATTLLAPNVRHAEPGEKRLLLAVALGEAPLLVRLVYACIGTFAANHDFQFVGGRVDLLAAMSVAMEMLVVVIIEGVGLTLHKVNANNNITAATTQSGGYHHGKNEQARVDHDNSRV